MAYEIISDYDVEKLQEEFGVELRDFTSREQEEIDIIKGEIISDFQADVIEKQVEELVQSFNSNLIDLDIDQDIIDEDKLKEKLEEELEFGNGHNYFNYANSSAFDGNIYDVLDKQDFLDLGLTDAQEKELRDKFE